MKHHENTPTLTFRNRACEAPWPVPMLCMGSPFPQFGVPQSVQYFSFVIASQLFQKSGVIPAYVQFFRSRPRLPFLISYPTSVPNWKLSRMSSILHERLVSMNMPSSVSAMRSSSSQEPGSKETFVIRINGMRFQPSARMQPLLRKPSFDAVSRDMR